MAAPARDQPRAGTEFVWHLEDVTSLHPEAEADPHQPYVCFDETSKPLAAETRAPLPPRPGQPERF